MGTRQPVGRLSAGCSGAHAGSHDWRASAWAATRSRASENRTAAVIHYIWVQKSDYAEPLMWAGWLAFFLLIRVYLSVQKRRAKAAHA